MALDPTIILGGQQFDLLGAINAGRESAMQQKAFDQQNALAELYRTQGAGMAAGNQNSLNALAQYDPAAAQTMAYSAEDQQRQRDESRARAEEALKAQAANLTAEQLAAEQKALSDVLTGAAFFYQKKDQAGYEAFLKSKGADPAEYPFQSFPAHAASVEGVLDAMSAFAPPEPYKPQSSEGKLAADVAAGIVPAGTIAQPGVVVNNMGEGGSDKQLYDTIAASADRAGTALVGLNGLAEANKALDDGAITGFAADQRLYLAKLGNYLGVKDPAEVENTETFRAAIAPQVAAMIKATVGSANISNSDREFAEKAAAGSIQLDEASIKRMIGVMDKMGREAIKLHNQKVNKVYPEKKGFDQERALFLLDEPAAIGVGDSDSPPPTGGTKRLKFNPETGEIK